MTDVDLDPSRIAAQVVSGVGFLGAGIIFVRSDAVRGLTTAAAVWVTAAIGMAAGAGLPLPATATTLICFIVAYVHPHMVRALPQSAWAPSLVTITYLDGRGPLRDILARCTAAGFEVVDVSFRRPTRSTGAESVGVDLRMRGPGRLSELLAALEEPDGVLSVEAGTTDHDDEE
jgi:putative Mg2+ transporter-C (MgtC) family protein